MAANHPPIERASVDGDHQGTPRRSWLAVCVAVAVSIQGLAFAAGGIAVLTDMIRGASTSIWSSGYLALLGLAGCAVVMAAIRGMLRGRRWAVSVLVTIQIFGILLGWSTTSVAPLIGGAILAWCGVSLVGLVVFVLRQR